MLVCRVAYAIMHSEEMDNGRVKKNRKFAYTNIAFVRGIISPSYLAKGISHRLKNNPVLILVPLYNKPHPLPTKYSVVYSSRSNSLIIDRSHRSLRLIASTVLRN